MEIGLFGGTFDPPHLGHLTLAKDFYKESGLDLLIVMPSYIPPHKDNPGTDALSRLEMTRLNFSYLDGENINYVISSYEIDKRDVSYTVDTVMHLKNMYNVGKLNLCIGSDMLLCFEKWKNYEKILQNCRLFSKERMSGEYDKLRAYADYLADKYGAVIQIMKSEAIEVSSTSIRKHIQEYDQTKLISPAVADYIKAHKLYGSRGYL